MDYLIYYSIANDDTREWMLNKINDLSENIYYSHCVIKVRIGQTLKNNSDAMRECLCGCLSSKVFEVEDELYLYYWSSDINGVWLLKKKGCLKMKLVHKHLDRSGASLGAKLGRLD